MMGLFARPFPMKVSVFPSSSRRESPRITELIAESMGAIDGSFDFTELVQVPAQGSRGTKESKGT